MDILTKADNIKALKAGSFGNKLRHWSSLSELHASAYAGAVTVRDRRVSGLCRYNCAIQDIPPSFENPYFNESAPDSHLLIQGEIQRDTRYISLFYSEMKTQMRTALRENPMHADGIVAMELLRCHLWPRSYDDLWELLETFDDHVIEFSAYDIALGDCRSRNTIIWEVRKF